MQGMVSAERLYDLMDGVMDSHSLDSCGASFRKTSGDKSICASEINTVHAERLQFAYLSHPDKYILNDFSLKMERGQIVAMVGKKYNHRLLVI